MTPEQHHDLFGLADSFPLPAWAVLDTARAHRFTGELTFDVDPVARVYLDYGRIYLAERAVDPPLGDRLVDAGVLTSVQREHGALRVGETEHLGRLFERVPGVDREIVLLTTELMNDTCVAWIAGQQVASVTGTPYLRHPSGIHRWDRPVDAVDLERGDPLPAPAPTDIPFATPDERSADDDPLITWDPSGWLDERPTPPFAPPPPLAAPAARVAAPEAVGRPTATDFASPDAGPVTPSPETAPMPPPVAEPAQDVPAATADPAPPAPDSGPTPATPSTSTSTSILDDDWVDRLERHGLPAQGDPLATPAQLPAVNVDRPDRFELIWPSGEVDEDFGAVAAVAGDDGRDRVGTTARVVRAVQVVDEPDPTEEPTDLWDFEATGPIFGAAPAPSDAPAADPGDETVLSMRRAIDTIEAESRSRDVTVAQPDPVHSPDLPGRIAARGESSVWTIPTTGTTTGESVFDDVRTPPSFDPGPGERAPATSGDAEPAPEPDRVSALRRLIGGLRRR